MIPWAQQIVFLTIHSVIKNPHWELCISYLDDVVIGGFWVDILHEHEFQRVMLLAQDIGLSLNLNKCKLMCRDHTTPGSLQVNIPGLMVMNPESSTHLCSLIGWAEGIDSILGKKINSVHILGEWLVTSMLMMNCTLSDMPFPFPNFLYILRSTPSFPSPLLDSFDRV